MVLSQLCAVSLASSHQFTNGDCISYHRSEGSSPGIIFLPGFRSSMTGSKALTLEERFSGSEFLRFDYRGHGTSTGCLEKLALTDWIEDAMVMLNIMESDQKILVGSSMGAWIGMHCALQRDDICGIVGIASGVDFTKDLLSDELYDRLAKNGCVELPSKYSREPYLITRHLLHDSQKWYLLDKPSIPLDCPVQLIHGQQDSDIPWSLSLEIAEKLESQAVTVTLVKSGDHRLSTSSSLQVIVDAVANLVQAEMTNNESV